MKQFEKFPKNFKSFFLRSDSIKKILVCCRGTSNKYSISHKLHHFTELEFLIISPTLSRNFSHSWFLFREFIRHWLDIEVVDAIINKSFIICNEVQGRGISRLFYRCSFTIAINIISLFIYLLASSSTWLTHDMRNFLVINVFLCSQWKVLIMYSRAKNNPFLFLSCFRCSCKLIDVCTCCRTYMRVFISEISNAA